VIDGNDGADTISAGSGDDTITGGAKADTLTGGAGADTFVVTTAADSNASTAGLIDKITDFAWGTDFIKVGAAGAELNSQTLSVAFSAADTIAELNGLLDSATGTSTANFDGSGVDIARLTTSDNRVLLAIDVDADGACTAADVVVEITGASGTAAFASIII